MTKKIPLSTQRRSNSRNLGLVALVDDEDYEWLSQWNWTTVSAQWRNGAYAVRIQNGKLILIHRQIPHAPPGAEVDHTNGNGSDNQRSNLHFATRQQDQANRQLFKSNQSGLHWENGKWCSLRILILPKKPLECMTTSCKSYLTSMRRPTLTSSWLSGII